MSKKPVVAWDSTVFLAWLNKERDKPLDEIAHLLDQVIKKEIVLLVSAQVEFEIFSARYTDEQRERVENFLLRPGIERVDTTSDISKKAGRMRDWCMQEGHSWRKADLLILAAAITRKAIVLHTTDKDHLLRLDGTPITEGVSIRFPSDVTGQAMLPGTGELDDPLDAPGD
jgi:predicted nucleic acid-binding protein